VLRLPGLEGWQRGEIRRTALPIYDINGNVLFLDHTVAQGTKSIGTVRAAASKVMGPTVVSLISGPRGWNYDLAVKQLAPRVEKGHPDWKLVDSKLVCYSYPKLGVRTGAPSKPPS
jgi:hypothetical protein